LPPLTRSTDAAASSRSAFLMLLDLRLQCVSLWLGVACYTDATWGFWWFQASSGLAKSRKASDSKLDYSDITVCRPLPPSSVFISWDCLIPSRKLEAL
jgi:hypothetical protein